MDPINALIHAPTGHGKTTFLGTAAGDDRLSPFLLIAYEPGLRAIRSKIRRIRLASQIDSSMQTHPILDQTIKPSKETIDVIQLTRWAEFDEIYEFLANDNKVYRGVGIDSLSEMNYLNLTDNVRKAVRSDPKHDPDVPEQMDYQRSQLQIKKVIRFFRDLPLHVFFTAGSTFAEYPFTRRLMVMPSVVGKLVNELPGLFDIVGYLAVVSGESGKEPPRLLMLSPDDRFLAKSRVEGGSLADIENPTLPKLLDAILQRETHITGVQESALTGEL